MLRITRHTDSDSIVTLKLEGKLLGPWVREVRHAYYLALAQSTRARLDLSALTFVDPAGVELLRDLIREDVEIVACSNYVAETLK